MPYTGRSVPRIDSRAKVTGEATYVTDLFPHDPLTAKLKRSPHPHARVVDVDAAAALAMDGVEAVLTPRDVPAGRNGSDPPRDQAILNDTARFQGDPVAAVAAVDEATAAAALGAIDVEYDRLDAVFDPEAAMDSDAPQLHADAEANVIGETHYERGDPDAAMARADDVIETRVRTSRQTHAAPETYGCIARVRQRKSRRIDVWTTVDKPYYFRDELARVLDVPAGDIRVRLPPTSSASFGKKNYLIPSLEPVAVLLSRETERPVRLVLDRDEDFVGTVTRHPAVITLRTGVTEAGDLTGRTAHVITDTGAYVQMGNHVKDAMRSRFADLYPVPDLRYDAYNVYTNHPIAGAARGIGSTQIHYAMETHMDEVAGAIDADPVALRERYRIQEGDAKADGSPVEGVGLGACLERGADAAGWPDGTVEARDGERVGVGMACCIHISGSSRDRGCSASLKGNPDGTVDLLVSNPDTGHGAEALEAQVAADVLGIRPADVTVSTPDTAVTPYDTYGSTASRSSYVVSRAVSRAATAMRARLLDAAAGMLDADPDGLSIEDGVVSAAGDGTMSVAAVIEREGMVQGFGSFDEPPSRSTFGAYFAEVAVDEVTGAIDVRRVVGAQDVGYAINPAGCEAQVEGGVAFGTEFLLDELATEAGRATNTTLVDFKALAARSVPDDIETVLVESAREQGVAGAKGLGTGVMPAVAPAIANAVADATGVRVRDLPLRPEHLIDGLEGAT